MKKLFLSVVALLGAASLWAQSSVVETFNKGAGEVKAQNFAAAAASFEQVIEQGIDSQDATELNCVETAKKYLPTCYQGMGAQAASKGQFDEAIAAITKAVQKAELYGNVDAMNKANALLSKVYQAQGGTAFNNKDYAAAAAIFEKGYAANPRNTQMALWLGTCYCELGDFQKGMDVLEKVAAMDSPKYAADAAEARELLAKYTLNMVAKYQEANDLDGLIAIADQMLADNPSSALGQKVRLQAYFNKKDYNKVIELAEAAAAAQTDEAEKSNVYFILGAAYNAKEMKDQTIAAMQKVTSGTNVEAAKQVIADLSK